MGKLKDIIDGWTNLITDNQEVKEIAQSRAIICSECPLNINNTCSKNIKGKAVKSGTYNGMTVEEGKEYTGCGCYLPAKTKAPNTSCPLLKW